MQTRLVSSGIGIITRFLYNGAAGMVLGKETNKFPVHMRYETLKCLLIQNCYPISTTNPQNMTYFSKIQHMHNTLRSGIQWLLVAGNSKHARSTLAIRYYNVQQLPNDTSFSLTDTGQRFYTKVKIYIYIGRIRILKGALEKEPVSEGGRATGGRLQNAESQ
jgi:hypothetical protein